MARVMAMAGAGLGAPSGEKCRLRMNRKAVCCCVRDSVVVTRERGKNEKLIKALRVHEIDCLELPLIEHTPGPDVHKLPATLRDNSFQWIVVTSPEAAAVFLDGWKRAGSPRMKIAAVGDGTKQVFDGMSGLLEVSFVPSQANASALARELPKLHETQEVLYPASLKASHELATGLELRGFKVLRLNTYSTECVKSLKESDVALAVQAPVVTFGSPTAVKSWVELVVSKRPSGWNGAAACIGSTSAAAARKAGMTNIFYAEKPGVDGWVQSVVDALKWIHESKS